MAARKDKRGGTSKSSPPPDADLDSGWFDEDEAPTRMSPVPDAPRAAKASEKPAAKTPSKRPSKSPPKAEPKKDGAPPPPARARLPVPTSTAMKNAAANLASRTKANSATTPNANDAKAAGARAVDKLLPPLKRQTMEVQVEWLEQEPPTTDRSTIMVQPDWLEVDDEEPTTIGRGRKMPPPIPKPPPLPKVDTEEEKRSAKPPSRTPPRPKR